VQKRRRTISVVVPVFNERDNIRDLIKSVDDVFKNLTFDYELLVVDDGSTDDTLKQALAVHQQYPNLKLIELRRNFGQTAAMAAGFHHASGDVIIPIDGDLQNDPEDIPRLVAKLDEGYDVVSGWRKNRKDTFLTRRLPSWLANRLIAAITQVRLHDYGCTIKAYRKDVVQSLNLYGEMHRFIPAIAHWSGARVAEIVVNHRPRTRGQAKYGLSRTLKVVLDLITVKFLGSFSTKPLHIFGGIGAITLLAAFLSGTLVIYQKWFAETPLAMNRNPLLVLTTMLIMMSVQFLLMGLIAEMLCRTYHESQSKQTFVVRAIHQAKTQNSQTPPSPSPESLT